MPWYRTRSGQLIHAVGGLAAVHVSRGAVEVPDDEIDTRAAQALADADALLAAGVDEAERKRAEAAKNKPTPVSAPSTPLMDAAQGVPAVPQLVVEHDPRPPLTEAEQAAVDQAVRDETPR